jgi:hypothetical protein
MYKNPEERENYDSSIPSDLINKANLFQRASLINMKNNYQHKDAAEFLKIEESIQTQKYESRPEGEDNLLRSAPIPPSLSKKVD